MEERVSANLRPHLEHRCPAACGAGQEARAQGVGTVGRAIVADATGISLGDVANGLRG
jgi:hypothetical protein